MPTYHPIPRGAIRICLPDTTQQKDYSCGASCLQSICKYYGVGPDDEWEFVNALGMDYRIGTHPFQVIRAAHRYGLRCREYWPMTVEDIQAEVRRRHPVMVMFQAWGWERFRGGSRRRVSYLDQWEDGHWAVAIGYDREGVFFEDPSLQAIRGFLTYKEFQARWHDTGPYRKIMRRYGVAIWHPHRRTSSYTARAKRIP